MFIRLVYRLLLVLAVSLAGANVKSSFSQTDSEIEQRIEQGKKFMAGARVREWKKYLREVPSHCKKMSLVKDGKLHSEYFYSLNHSLVISYLPDGSSTLNLRNPKYAASVLRRGETLRLEFFKSVVLSPYPSPLDELSLVPGAHSLWAALKAGLIEVADFRSEDGTHCIKFVPLPEGLSRGYQFDYYELRFDERVGPFPDKSITKRLDGSYVLISHYDLIEMNGFKVPTKRGFRTVPKHDSKLTPSFDLPSDGFFEIRIEPAVDFTESIFYLPHYGLPEPNLGSVADFSQRPYITRSALVTVAIIIIVVTVFICARRKLHER